METLRSLNEISKRQSTNATKTVSGVKWHSEREQSTM